MDVIFWSQHLIGFVSIKILYNCTNKKLDEYQTTKSFKNWEYLIEITSRDIAFIVWVFFKHAFLKVHNIKVMEEENGLSIKKLLENTFIYQIMSHTKTKKLVLTRSKIKHNVIVLWHHII